MGEKIAQPGPLVGDQPLARPAFAGQHLTEVPEHLVTS
jgi:hypothetical protein